MTGKGAWGREGRGTAFGVPWLPFPTLVTHQHDNLAVMKTVGKPSIPV